MTHPMRIVSSATASPTHNYRQETLINEFCRRLFGNDWADRPDVKEHVHAIERMSVASRVEHRQMAVEGISYHSGPHTTGERMLDYERLSYPLAREAVEGCLERIRQPADAITDFIVVSCTGYCAPGLDILLARDLGMQPDVRRLVIGHMGCSGAIIGLRSALAALQAHEATVLLLTIELCSLHFVPSTMDMRIVPGIMLFGDAAASLLLTSRREGTGPELIDAHCASDFGAAGQITWKITDEGFIMGLSRRIPITLRRNVAKVVDDLLAPHGLTPADIAHWLVHPGGPDILEVIGHTMALSQEQMSLSWEVLRDHGNCSSSTVLLMLDRLLRSERARPGEWGVMMAFGPGLTLETCLLRF